MKNVLPMSVFSLGANLCWLITFAGWIELEVAEHGKVNICTKTKSNYKQNTTIILSQNLYASKLLTWLGRTASFPVFCPIKDTGSITFCNMGWTGEDIMIVEPKK